MEKLNTTTKDGRTIELEIVQNGTRGWAVNFHEIEECVGLVSNSAGGYTATTELGNDAGEWTSLGEYPNRWEALAAIIRHLQDFLPINPNAVDPAEAAPAVKEALAEIGIETSDAALRDVCRRAAYDMGIYNRGAHPEILPAIAYAAADMLRAEARK